MSYLERIDNLNDQPEQLEQLYQEAVTAGESEVFNEAINATYAGQPGNLLYAAWYYRLQQAVVKAKGRVIAWGWAIPLAVLNGLIFWLLSDEQFMISMRDFSGQHDYDFLPLIILIWAPISAVFIMSFLALAGKKRWQRVAAITASLVVLVAYVLLLYPQTGTRPFQEQYLTLAAIHLPLMAWTGIGLFLLWRQRDAENRFAFLIKSLEVIITVGLFGIAGGIFTGITFGLFQALNVEPPEYDHPPVPGRRRRVITNIGCRHHIRSHCAPCPSVLRRGPEQADRHADAGVAAPESAGAGRLSRALSPSTSVSPSKTGMCSSSTMPCCLR